MSDTASRGAAELRIDAPHRELLDQVLDKWSLSVLNELCERPCRFNELRRAIPAVTQKSLTATLRRLERNGIVDRHVVATRPVAVEYRITRLGKTLREKYLTRINDKDRWEYVKALALDVGYEGDTNRASDTFWACQRLRNVVAHSNQLQLVREHNSADYYFQLPPGVAAKDLPSPLTPAVFRQFAANCRWLNALIVHLESLGGENFVSPVGRQRADGSVYSPRIEMLAPPPLPIPPDWNTSQDDWRELPDEDGSEA